MVHLDTRSDSLALATDVVFDPLSFEGIRRAFPSLKTRGDLRGRFRSEGTLSRLAVDADLTGDLGAVRAEGFVTLLPPKWGADGLRLHFTRLDLATLGGGKLPTALAGELRATGSIDTLRAPEGDLELALTRSRIREWTIDSLFGRGGVHDSVIRVDTAYAEWQGARAAGARHPRLAGAARRTDALRPRRRQPDRLRFAAARGHPAAARHLRRGAAARRARRRPGGPGGKPRLAPGGRELRGGRPRVAAHPLAPGHRQHQLAGRRATPARGAGGRGYHPGAPVPVPARRGRGERVRRLGGLERRNGSGRDPAIRRGGTAVPEGRRPSAGGGLAARQARPASLPAAGAVRGVAGRLGARRESPDPRRPGRLERRPGGRSRARRRARRPPAPGAWPRPARPLRPAAARHPGRGRRRRARPAGGRDLRRADLSRPGPAGRRKASATSRRRSSRGCSTTRGAGWTPTSTSGAPARTCFRWKPTCRSISRSPAWSSGGSTARSRCGPTPTASTWGCWRRSRRRSPASAAPWSARRAGRGHLGGAAAGGLGRHQGRQHVGPGARHAVRQRARRRHAGGRLGPAARRARSPAAADGSRSAARCGWRSCRRRCSRSISGPSSSAPSTSATS